MYISQYLNILQRKKLNKNKQTNKIQFPKLYLISKTNCKNSINKKAIYPKQAVQLAFCTYPYKPKKPDGQAKKCL